jgi:CoA:oxalate CoA-transferase
VPAEGPLTGVRVVELGQLIAGPVCGRVLSLLGAEVIKIEPPQGDPARRLPPFVADGSATFGFANAGKQLVSCDLRTRIGREEASRLIDACDVVVENGLPNAFTALGLADEPPGARERAGIRCSIRAGGERSGPAVDSTIQAASGLMWLNGDDQRPQRLALPIIDLLAGVFAAVTVSAALASATHRRGWVYVVSMTDVAAFMQGPMLLASMLGIDIQPMGGHSPFVAPSQPLKVLDGHVALSVLDDQRWAATLRLLEVELPGDLSERYATTEGRLRHDADVQALLQAAVETMPIAELQSLMTSERIPCERVRTLAEAAADIDLPAGQPGIHAAAEAIPTPFHG